ncbi:MAG TPA: DNA gyrase modulator, partial [Rhodocyclaceae bacterium]|nr:DNA gyrase modulator [Rhodocyclaceae bacterium]
MSDPHNALATAERYLLNPFSLGENEIGKVFGKLMGHRLDYADLYFQYHRSEGWSLEEGIVKSGSFNIEQGVGVRAISGEKTAFAYSDDIALPALTAAAEATRAIAEAGASGREHAVTPRAGAPVLYRADDPLASLDDTAKVRLLERLEGFARAEDGRVTQVMAHVAGSWEVVMVARHDGH